MGCAVVGDAGRATLGGRQGTAQTGGRQGVGRADGQPTFWGETFRKFSSVVGQVSKRQFKLSYVVETEMKIEMKSQLISLCKSEMVRSPLFSDRIRVKKKRALVKTSLPNHGTDITQQ